MQHPLSRHSTSDSLTFTENRTTLSQRVIAAVIRQGVTSRSSCWRWKMKPLLLFYL